MQPVLKLYLIIYDRICKKVPFPHIWHASKQGIVKLCYSLDLHAELKLNFVGYVFLKCKNFLCEKDTYSYLFANPVTYHVEACINNELVALNINTTVCLWKCLQIVWVKSTLNLCRLWLQCYYPKVKLPNT